VPSRIVARQSLRHNPRNEVTESVERVTDGSGDTHIRKRLRRPDRSSPWQVPHWAASEDPRHWNYWRREADAYADDALRGDLADAGLSMPAATLDEDDDGVTLWLEDVQGTPGTDFAIEDHRAVATGLGHWQAGRPLQRPWASRRFLRDYSAGKPVTVDVDNDHVWRQPLVRDAWPADLRPRWLDLLAHREALVSVMERLPRVASHLDVWVSNELRRPNGEVVLVDWAFCGDGAIGEDIGNHVPDAVSDLFWPAERIAELDAVCFDAYLAGLRHGGWHGDPSIARLGMVASCVKYTWLLPGMLDQSAATAHQAYGEAADSLELYRRRGLVFEHLVGWFDEARTLSDRI
jgi:hypothetical protein